MNDDAKIEPDSGPLIATLERERTWFERLFTRPWRPLQRWETVVTGPLGVSRGGFEFTINEKR